MNRLNCPTPADNFAGKEFSVTETVVRIATWRPGIRDDFHRSGPEAVEGSDVDIDTESRGHQRAIDRGQLSHTSKITRRVGAEGQHEVAHDHIKRRAVIRKVDGGTDEGNAAWLISKRAEQFGVRVEGNDAEGGLVAEQQ